MPIFISTIIPTIGRVTLSRAVRSVIDQHFRNDEFEVIVINDSGRELPDMSWMKSPNVQILNTNRRERSVARNTGAAIARGKYLHFLDDDDWILPNAYNNFRTIIQNTKAGMYYGGYQFVNSNGNKLQEFFPNESGNCFIRFMSGEWQPLQASLFDVDTFHKIGGFTSLELLLGGDEDVDLTRRISLHSNIIGMREPVAVICVERSASTTNYENLHDQSRQSRELILSLPRVFSRLHHSAIHRNSSSDYWHGRITWIYLSSAVWNLQQKRFFTAISRLTFFLLGVFLAFKYWISPKFWKGATLPHQANGWLVSEN